MDSAEAPERVLDEAREQIDEIDDRLLALLNRRAGFVLQIGEAKRRLGMAIYQPDREEAVFRRLNARNEGPLEDAAIRRLFERILDESRRLERGP